jgi:hypothetical protein
MSTSKSQPATPGQPDPQRPRSPFRRIGERTRDRIDELVAQGYFSNLPNSGKPLDFSIEDNPFVPEDLRTPYRLLINAGYGLPWMEERKIIDRKRAELESEISRQHRQVQNGLANLAKMPAYLRPSRWDRLRATHSRFVDWVTRQVDALNRAIDAYNLGVPSTSLQVTRLRREVILDALKAALPDEAPGAGSQ